LTRKNLENYQKTKNETKELKKIHLLSVYKKQKKNWWLVIKLTRYWYNQFSDIHLTTSHKRAVYTYRKIMQVPYRLRKDGVFALLIKSMIFNKTII
jgi:hypothetical protein